MFAFVLMAAAAAALMWHARRARDQRVGAATFALGRGRRRRRRFSSTRLRSIPEIPAALAVVVAFSADVDGAWARRTDARVVIVGLACAALPWLSTKYAPMSAALVAIALARIVRGRCGPTAATVVSRSPADRARLADCGTLCDAARPRARRAVRLLAARLVLFLLRHLGHPLPQAPYGDARADRLCRTWSSARPGLLFDQEYGLLPYAPVYILAGDRAVGDVARRRRHRGARRSKSRSSFAALLGTVGAFRIWWGGPPSPGRPLTSGLLLLALPIAIAFRAAPAGSARRAAQHLLLWVSVGIAVVLLFAETGFLIANGRDGTSALLEYLSPRWPRVDAGAVVHLPRSADRADRTRLAWL